MNDSDIILEIFPMNFINKFNLSNFYAFIIPTNADEDMNTDVYNILNLENV